MHSGAGMDAVPGPDAARSTYVGAIRRGDDFGAGVDERRSATAPRPPVQSWYATPEVGWLQVRSHSTITFASHLTGALRSKEPSKPHPRCLTRACSPYSARGDRVAVNVMHRLSPAMRPPNPARPTLTGLLGLSWASTRLIAHEKASQGGL